MSEAGLVDFAAIDAGTVDSESAVDSTVENTEVSTQETEVQDNGVDETTEPNENNSDQTAEQKVDTAKAAGPIAPKHISDALRALKEDPANAGAAKVLRDAYFAQQAFSKEFTGGMKEAREIKSFLSEVSGADGQPVTLEQARDAYATQRAVIQNIEETDQLVRSGDATVWDNIIEDLKSENKMDALPKLVSGGLDKLNSLDEEGYASAVIPHLSQIAKSTGLNNAIVDAWRALEAGDGEAAKKALLGISGLVKGWHDKAAEMQKQNSEEARVNAKLSEREQAIQTKERTEFRTGVATEADKYSNTSLGAQLKTYLKSPFFKGFPRETLVDLGNGIKERLYQTLEADKDYQRQM